MASLYNEGKMALDSACPFACKPLGPLYVVFFDCSSFSIASKAVRLSSSRLSLSSLRCVRNGRASLRRLSVERRANVCVCLHLSRSHLSCCLQIHLKGSQRNQWLCHPVAAAPLYPSPKNLLTEHHGWFHLH